MVREIVLFILLYYHLKKLAYTVVAFEKLRKYRAHIAYVTNFFQIFIVNV